MSATSRLAVARARWRLEGVRVPATALWVAAICAVGLGLRLAWVLYADTIPLGGDPHWYYVVGINLSQGFGFVADRNEVWEIPGPGEPTAFWPPGYPLALAALFKLFGVSVTSAKVLNAVLGALTVPFVYGLGSAIFSRRVGLAGAGAFAVLPGVIAPAPLLFPEPLFVLLFVAALWLLVAFPPGSRSGWLAAVGFGLLAGMATLTRGQGVVLMPVAVWYWLTAAGWRPALRPTALAVLAAAAVIVPWTVRNAVEMDAFIPISTNSGAALRVGHNADSTGTTGWTDDYIDGFYMWESLYRPEWEVRGYREYTRLAVEYAFTHPRHELQLAGKKVYHLYRPESWVIPWLTTLGATPIEPEGLEDALRWAFNTSYFVVLIAAVAGVPFWLRRDANRQLLISVVLFWTLFHVAFLGEPRYHAPLYPVFAIAAAAGVFAALDWRGRRREEQV